MKANHLRKRGFFLVAHKVVSIITVLLFSAHMVFALPSGQQVVNGQADFNTQGNNLTITNSPNAIINWQGFSIYSNEAVRFIQQSNLSSVLNRVIGQDPSRILGLLQSNGRVFLINPNGILFGQGARIDVNGLFASTLNISNQDFLAGRYNFNAGTIAGSIQNQGTITTPTGGKVFLIAPDIENSGIINSPQGDVILAAGHSVQLIDSLNPDISVVVSAPENKAINLGQIIAQSGKVGIYGGLIAQKGIVNADSVVSEGGRIFLKATKAIELADTSVISADGTKGGQIVVKTEEDGIIKGTLTGRGLLSAQGDGSRDSGGFIETSAAKVDLNGIRVRTNGGNWLIDPAESGDGFTIAASNGDIDGATLSGNLSHGNVSILSTGGSGTDGSINVNDTVNWSAYILTLTATNDVNINTVMTASGTASLDLEPGSNKVNVGFNPDGSFKGRVDFFQADGITPRSGAGFLIINGNGYTVINSLGAEGSLTGTDLQGMNGTLSGYYALGSDIDASATSTANSGVGWNSGLGFEPVGSSSDFSFTGVFDGLGHTITGLNINRQTIDYVGLFGYISGVVQNVGLLNGNIIGKNSVGGLVGYNNYSGIISNSYNTGAVTGSTYVGGLVGYSDASDGGSISNSHSTGLVTGSTNVGGLVGYNTGSIDSSWNEGTVIGDGAYVGGLVGYNGIYGVISNSYSTGAVNGSTNVGGLVGYNDGTVGNSHYDIDNVTINGAHYVTEGGLYNSQYAAWIDSEMKPLDIVDYSENLPSNGDYYTISSTQGLKDMLGFLDGGYNFQLTDNLTALPGWYLPVFNGTFDGAGYTLANLSVNQPFNDNIGFIGRLNSGSTLTGLGLTNVSVTGRNNVGGLVGYNSGSIINSHSTGAITGTDYVGGLVGYNESLIRDSYNTGAVNVTSGGGYGGYGGGLVGYNDAYYDDLSGMNYYGIIRDSYNTGAVNVTSGGGYGGGLVGENYGYIGISYNTGAVTVTGDGGYGGGLAGKNYLTIRNSYSTGDVTVTGYGGYGGGLVGYNDLNGGTIKYAYSTGAVNVTGSDGYGGGLVGYNDGTIRYTYSTGAVTVTGSGGYGGGLVGYDNSGGGISYSYWDTDTSGKTSSSSGTGLTTTQFFDANNFDFYFDITPGAFNGWVIVGADGTLNNIGASSNTRPMLLSEYSTNITNAHQLQLMAMSLDADYTLARDIDMSELTKASGLWNTNITTGPTGFVPVGNYENNAPFIGAFDGLGHTINNLSINRPDADYVGLFGYTSSSAAIRNVGLVEGNITGNYYVGGLVGSNNGSITNSFSTATVTGTDSVGGLVGENYGAITNSYSTGAVTGINDVGGLVGHNEGAISNSYSTGKVNNGAVSPDFGGLVGTITGGTITNSFWDKETSLQTSSAGEGVGAATGLTTAQMMTQNSYPDGGQSYWDFAETWWMSEGNTRPFLRSEYSTNITNAHQLQLMGMNATTLNATYTLAGNINMSELAQASGLWNTTKGFVPVGNSTTNFTGAFDGNGHTINNLYINRPSTLNYIGLFGYTSAAATISNAKLESVDITGNNLVGGLVGYNMGAIGNSYSMGAINGAGSYVGGLAGYNMGAISNSYSMGTVTGSDYVGGLVGYNKSTINNSYSTGTVSGDSNVGGLAGINKGGAISNSYSMGAVTGNDYVGGLVGGNWNATTTIDNSYSTGTVNGTSYVGGLVGENSGAITNSYSTGTVSGSGDYVGGLVGSNYGAISNAFWDTLTTGKDWESGIGFEDTSSILQNVAGYETVDLMLAITYAEWSNFGSNWFMIDGQTRPFLKSEWSTSISNAHQLQLMSMNLGASYSLASNIDMSELKRASGMWNSSYDSTNQIWTGTGFVPAGSNPDIGPPFTGAFNGNKHTITGLYINRPSEDNIGLFGNTDSSAAIRNVGLVNGYITGSFYVGGLVGTNYGTISNSYSTIAVHGNDRTGGLVGRNGGLISNSYATGNVEGDTRVGGLTGANGGTIENSYATGSVTGNDNVGGLSGRSGGKITNSYSTGAVAGINDVGGLVGENYGGILNSYHSTGAVIVTGSYVGGLVGENYGRILNSHNTGAVSGTTDVGGLVGYNEGNILSSWNEGNVTGSGDYVGGLMGYNYGGNIVSSYNTGAVSSSGDYVGGLVGHNDYNITNAYATGAVTGNDYVGGLVGENHGTIDQAWSSGLVSSTGDYVGGLAGSNYGSISNAFWDTLTTGKDWESGIGFEDTSSFLQNVAGYTTADLMLALTYADWSNFDSNWFMIDGQTRPFLNSEWSTSISNAHQLQLMAMSLDADYTLARDIDMSELTKASGLWNTNITTGPTGFVPVGNYENNAPFIGAFDGLGHTINNLSINRPDADYVGLFGYTSSSAAIRNVGLVEGNITGNYYVGGLVGENDGTITNSYSTITVNGTDSVGGLAGKNYGAITNSYSTGAVTGTGGTGGQIDIYSVGGLVGDNYGSISDSYSTGTVTGTDDVGGLVGYNDGTISNSYSSGAVTGITNVGGLVGYNDQGNITNSHYDMSAVIINGDTGVVTRGALNDAQYTEWIVNKTLNIDNYFNAQDGDGYYTISTAVGTKDSLENLLGFAGVADPNLKFRLGSDIDMSGSPGLFIPYFSAAEFDGAGKPISNLTLTTAFNYKVGFFGELKSGAAVKNLGVTNVNVSGSEYVGGLAGYNGGATIADSYSTGSVTGSAYVGGLVGKNYSLSADTGIIHNSYSTAAVTGNGNSNYVGGLVGYNEGGATIADSYGTGSVTGSAYIGGLVGVNYGTISNSYSTGAVTGSGDYVGGLVGYNDYNITNAYATGAVSGNNYVGGLVGENYGTIDQAWSSGLVSSTGVYVGGLVGVNYLCEGPCGIIINSYWDIDTSDQSSGVGGGYLDVGVSGLSMLDLTPFSIDSYYLDFQNTWYMVDGYTRPFLRSEYSTTITNAHQLQLMLLDMSESSSYTLARNIDMSELTPASGLWKTSTGFVPVGNSTTNFIGTFDGLGHTITDLNINRPSTPYVGLFGYNNGVVQNVGLVNGTIIGRSSVGGLVGVNYGDISNSYSTATVTETGAGQVTASVGGLVGDNYGAISNSYSTGAVTGINDVGGLVGYNEGTIENSYSEEGTVEGTGYNVGGLVGYNYGYGGYGSISDSYSTGTVTGKSYVGGLVGGNVGSGVNGGSITNSYSTGAVNVTGTGGYGGGLVGQNFGYGGISNSYSTGTVNVTGTGGYGGGLVGENYGFGYGGFGGISNSYSTGAVTGGYGGGLVGYNNYGSISNSFWNTETAGVAFGIGHDFATGFPSNTGATGLTTANMKKLDTFVNTGWSIVDSGGSSAVWRIYGGNTYPLLRSFLTSVTVTANNDSKTYDGQAYTGGNGVTCSTSSCDPYKYLVADGYSGYSGTSQGAINANSYTITPANYYSNQQGYDISFANGTLTVTKADYTSISGSKTYDGNADFSNVAVSGITGENFTVASAVSDSAKASLNNGAAKFISASGSITGLLGADTGNYNALVVSGLAVANNTATINRADYTSISGSKTYDGNADFSNVAVSGITGENFTVASAISDSAKASQNNGAAKFISASGSITGLLGADTGNYNTLSMGTLTTNTATIDRADYTSLSGTKTYNGSASFTSGQVTLSGVNGESFTVASAMANSANASANPTTPATTFTAVGSITGGADTGNYNTLSMGTLTTNTATIDRADYTSLSGSKTYNGDANFTGVALTGITGENFTVASAISDSAKASLNSGAAKFISASGSITGLSGADTGNYNALVVAGLTGANNAATIDRADYTSLSGSKTYNGDANFTGVALTGITGENFTVASAVSDSAKASLNSGAAKFISALGSITGLSGADTGNYNALVVSGLTGANNTATINRAEYTSLSGTKTYNGSASFTSGQVTLSGVNGESFTVASAMANSANASANPTTPATTFTAVGSITGGADTGNYNTLSMGTLTTNTATIDRADYTSLSGSKTYNGDANFTGVALTGITGENFTVASAVSDSAKASLNSGAAKFISALGSITGLSGADTGNYNALVVAGLTGANNAAAINRAEYTSLSGTKTYNGDANFTGVALTGITGENFTVASAVSDSAKASQNNGAAKFISALGSITGLSGADTGNYNALVVAGLTGANNTAAINRAEYTSLSGTKTYNGSASFTSGQVTLSGVNGESFTVASAMANSANASANPTTPATTFTAVGSITGGADTGNYNTLSMGTLTTNTATIDRADYTSLSGTKTYNGSASFTSGQVTLSGVNGESFTVASAMANSANASANPTTPATTFTAVGSITGGADTGNYNTLSMGTLTTNTATIDRADYTSLSGTKTYNGSASFTSGQVTLSGVNGESFTVASAMANSANASANPTTPATTFTAVGSITGGADTGNYNTLSMGALTTNTATIDRADYTSLSGSKTYNGDANFTGVALTGITGENFTVASAVSDSAKASLNNGAAKFISASGSITGLLGADTGNYNALVVSGLAVANNTATINRADYTSISGSKTYDGNADFSNVAVSGITGENFTVASAISDSAKASQNNGAAKFISASGSITGLSGADTGNYNALLVSGLTVANNTAAINWAEYTSLSGTKTYNGSASFTSGQVTLSGVNGESFTVASAMANSANASANPTTPATTFTAVGSITGGADTGNYNTLSMSALTTNTATIDRADYTSLSGSKTYNGDANFTGVALTGITGENFTVASAISDSAKASLNSGAAKFISASGSITGLSGADTGNYNALVVAGLTVANNTATINRADYTSLSGSKTYNGDANFTGVALTGITGENFTVASAVSDSAKASQNNGAAKFISALGSITGLSGADTGNYNALVVAGLTGANNAAAINRAEYTSLSGTKTYNGSASFTSGQVTLSGVNGESFTVASAMANSANASANPTTPATTFTAVGSITGGADTGNYNTLSMGALTTNTATIDRADYTSLSGSKTYNGDANFTGVALTGITGENFTVASAVSDSAKASLNSGAAKFISALGSITGLSGADTGNYNALVVAGLTGANNAATINRADYTSISGSKTYNGDANFTGVALTGITGENFTVASAVSDSAKASQNNGAAKFISALGSITGLSGADTGNYNALLVSGLTVANNTATINRAEYTSLSGTKTYNGSASFTSGQVTLSGVNGESFTVASAMANSANASANPTTPATTFTAVGSITGGADTGNYNTLSMGTLTTNTATIDRADYTSLSGSKTYNGDANFTGVALTGITGENFTVASAVSDSAKASLNSGAAKFISALGSITGLSGADTGNYNALVVAGLTGANNAATIDRAEYTSLSGTKTYDGNADFSNVAVSGITGENFTVASAVSDSAKASQNNGAAKFISASGSITGLSGADTGNYNALLVSGLTVANNTAAINRAEYTSLSGSKTYNGDANFTGVALTGITGENFTVASAVSDSAKASQNNGAAKFISALGSITGLSGADTGNYNALLVSGLTVANNTATINRAEYTSLSGTKTYNGSASFTSGQVTLSGVNGESFTVASAMANSANASANPTTPATTFTAVGSITGGADTGNYNTLSMGTLTTNTATIDRADYTSLSGSKTYNGDANFTGVALTGITGENFTVASAVSDSAKASLNSGAAKFISALGSITGLSGADTGNYNALVVAGLTGANNAATIDRAEYTSLSGTKTYDGNADFSNVAVSGITGENFTVASAVSDSAKASQNNGAAKFISASGSITGLSGADTGNYNALLVSGLTVANNTAAINRAEYTSLSGSKTYNGDANFTGVALTGITGENFTVASAVSDSAKASLNSGAAKFISASGSITGLSGADTGNYNALVVAGLTGANNAATIDRAALTSVSLMGTVTKTYDGFNTVSNLTPGNYSIAGFVSGEGATIGVTTGTYDNGKNVQAAGSPVASANLLATDYTPTGTTLLNNYDLSAVTGVAAKGSIGEITQKALTAVSLTGTVTKTYDGFNTVSNLTTGNYSIAGFVSGEGATITKTTGTYDAGKNVGGPALAVTSGSLVAGDYAATGTTLLSNYDLSAVLTSAKGNIGEITARGLTITAVTNTKEYDGNTSALAMPAVLGLQTGDSLIGLIEIYDSKISGTGKTLTPAVTINDGNGGNNYLVTYVNDTTGIINPGQIISGMLDVASGGKTIDFVMSGTLLGQTSTGIDGSYSFMLPLNSIPDNSALLTYVDSDSTMKSASIYLSNGGNITSLLLSSNTVTAQSSGAAMSNATLGTAKGNLISSDIPYTVSGNDLTLSNGFHFLTASGTNYSLNGKIITKGGNQTFNGPLSLSANAALIAGMGSISFFGPVTGSVFNLTLNSQGIVTQAAPVSLGGLELLGLGGTYNLAHADNSITTLAGNTGTVNFTNSTGLVIGTVNDTNGLRADGNVMLSSSGDLRLNAPVDAGVGQVNLTSNNGAIINGMEGNSTNISALSLVAFAANGIGSGNPLMTNVHNITAINTTSNNIEIDNTGVLAVVGHVGYGGYESYSGYGLYNGGNGNIVLQNIGAITTVDTYAVLSLGGSVAITAHSPLTIGTGGVSAYGNIALEAAATVPGGPDDLTINGTVSSASGNIAVKAGGNLVVGSGGQFSAPSGTIIVSDQLNNPPLLVDESGTANVAAATATTNSVVSLTAVTETIATVETKSDDEEKKKDKDKEGGGQKTDEDKKDFKDKNYCN